MKQKLVALIALSLLFAQSESAHSARTSGRNSRRAGSRSRASNVRVSGTTTTITATASDTTTVSSDYSKPAPITDAVAKRLCDKMVVAKLQENKTKFKTSAEAYARLTFPTYSEAPASANETFCANFLEDSVAKLWNSYDTYAQNDEKVCNIAKARATAAESCYQYAISAGNKQARLGIEKVFSESELDDYCGTEAIKKQYSLYSNGETLDDGDVGTSLTRPFSRVGASGWANLLAYSRMLDLKFDTRSTEWPREIVQLVNSINTQGQIACGRDFAAQLKDTSFQLVDKSSSLEKRVNEKGIFAGVKDWGVDQIGAFKGTNWANDVKAGKTKEEREEAKKAKNLTEAKKNYKKIKEKNDKLVKEAQEYSEKNTDISKANDEYKTAKEKYYKEEKWTDESSLTNDDIEPINILSEKQSALEKAIKKAKKSDASTKTKSGTPTTAEPEEIPDAEAKLTTSTTTTEGEDTSAGSDDTVSDSVSEGSEPTPGEAK